MSDVNKYDSVEEAEKAGEKPDDLFVAHAPTREKRDEIILAAQFGNRKTRRLRRFHPEQAYQGILGMAVTVPQLPKAERDRRAAQRRVAKKQRKQNGGK